MKMFLGDNSFDTRRQADQIYVNGHDWLECKCTAHEISFTKYVNVFLRMDEWDCAQKIADRFAGLGWPRILERYARYVNPLLKNLLHGYQHYWVTSQCEYSTDIISKSSSDLREPTCVYLATAHCVLAPRMS
jgi:hypothetical protein